MSVLPMEMELRAGPYMKQRLTTDAVMLGMLCALLPLAGFGTWLFGLSALLVTATAVAACVLTEQVICLAWRRPSTVGDYHAVMTGVLFALILPPALPLWMVALGGVVAIAIGKMLFGGLGRYLFAPALVGKLFLLAVFPAAMARLYVPPAVPGRFTSLIPSTLAGWPPFEAVTAYADSVSVEGWANAMPSLSQLFVGVVPGTIGETSALLILGCSLFLVTRVPVKQRVTVAILAAAFVTSVAFNWLEPGQHPGALFTLLTGGLVLGAVFIATDPMTSPTTRGGMWLYGALIGIVAVALRYKAPFLDATLYAILLGNLATPLIERVVRTRALGTPRWARKKTL